MDSFGKIGEVSRARKMDYAAQQDALARALKEPALDFNARALDLFRFQFESNAPYRAYCQSLGCDPEAVTAWREIPPLPCDAFKFDPVVFCGPLDEASCHFLSSGTTSERKGAHYFRETGSYARSVLAGWAFAELPALPRRAFLYPPPRTQPHSSLGFMFETLAKGADASWLLSESGEIDPGPLRRSSSPVLLFGTALGLLQLVSEHPELSSLPEGSWVFQTGGYKGVARDADPGTLYSLLEEHLAVPPGRVINEYGMTELSSQAYAIGPGTPHRCPPWLRFRIIDPHTGNEQVHGEEGYLCLYDLANLGSVLALRTQDIAAAVSEDEFLLRGRDPHALPRGCSRSSLTSPQPVRP